MDSRRFIGLIRFNSSEPLPEQLDLTVSVGKIGPTQGDWAFSIPLRKSNEDAETVMIMEGASSADYLITLNKIQFSLAGASLFIEARQQPGAPALSYELLDEEGKPYRLLGGENELIPGEDGAVRIKGRLLYEPPASMPAQITIRPYLKEARANTEETPAPPRQYVPELEFSIDLSERDN